MHYLAAALATWQILATDRLENALTSDRGDGPTDNVVLISVGVVSALLIAGLIAAAIDKYGAKIQ